jgi:glycerol kinase
VRHGDATALGTALLAGLAAGVWETGQVLDWLDSAGATEVYEAHDLDPLLRAERRLWRQLSSGIVS